MRRLLAITGLLLVVACLACAQEITIGVNLSSTGPASPLGIANKNSILLLPDSLAGLHVKFVILDDGSDPTAAVQNVKRLATENKIDVLMGPSITPTSMAVLDILAEHKIPAVVYGSSKNITSPQEGKRKWVFKSVADDHVPVSALMRHMAAHGVKTLSMIAIDDAYGESWVETVKALAPQYGIKILRLERFNRTDTGTIPQALRLIQTNPDAILSVAAGTPAVTPQLSIVERGYKGKIYQAGGAVSPDFLRIGGKAVEGTYSCETPATVADQLPDGYPTKQQALAWWHLYVPKYGPPPPYAVYPWDAFKLIQAAVPVALKSARPGTVEFREALRSALEKVRGVVGAGAVYSMSPNDHVGIDALGIAVLKVQNNKWTLEQAAEFKK